MLGVYLGSMALMELWEARVAYRGLGVYLGLLAPRDSQGGFLLLGVGNLVALQVMVEAVARLGWCWCCHWIGLGLFDWFRQ